MSEGLSQESTTPMLAIYGAATSFLRLLVFAASNRSLLVLGRRREAPFDVSPWMPYLGVVICCFLVVAEFLVSGGGH